MKLSAQGVSDGFSDAGFADTGRSHKAEDGTFQTVLQLAHCQVFNDAFLHFAQSVMILIQVTSEMSKVPWKWCAESTLVFRKPVEV